MEECSVVRRFKGKAEEWGSGLTEAIQFKTDRDIRVLGIGVYVGEGTSKATAKLLKIAGDNEDSAVEIVTKEETFYNPSETIGCISFTSPVHIRANEWHDIRATIIGERSHYGLDGKVRVEADGVVFDFRNSMLSSHTAVTHGQIPEIYFEAVKKSRTHDELKDTNQTAQIQAMRSDIDKLQTALDESSKKMRDLEMRIGESETKNQEQENRIDELENKYKRLLLMVGRIGNDAT